VADEHNEQPAEEPTEQPTEEPAEEPTEQPTDHHLKGDVRDAVARVVGIAVEAGSMLSGHSGEMVSAEGKVAESDTEQFIDRIDGEG
jgi:PT repeat